MDDADTYEHLLAEVRSAVYLMPRRLNDASIATVAAERLLHRARPALPLVLHEVAAAVLAETLDHVLGGGWSPADLVELVARNAGPGHVATLRGAMQPRRPVHTDVGALASMLTVAAQLLRAPLLHDSAQFTAAHHEVDTEAHPKLARVRALLAKAESTSFPEEAEALSAKAQELITRYSLAAMVDRAQASGASGSAMVTRRFWLDAPYVGAKSSLVHAVAAANHVRSASDDRHGFTVLVGAPVDVDSVELLVTSLLVQAGRAMLAHAARQGARSRSFRSSFLVAYAHRIGQRLREAEQAQVHRESADLLPVLRSHDEQVREAFDAIVPHTVGRSRPVSSREGWVAGVAAADLARLDVRRQVGDAG